MARATRLLKADVPDIDLMMEVVVVGTRVPDSGQYYDYVLVANEIAIDGDVVPLPIEKTNWEPAAPRADGRISKTQKRRAQAKKFKAKSLAPRGGEVTLVS